MTPANPDALADALDAAAIKALAEELFTYANQLTRMETQAGLGGKDLSVRVKEPGWLAALMRRAGSALKSRRFAALEADLQRVTAERDEARARADRIDAKLGELNAAVREFLPPVDVLVAEREAAEAALAAAEARAAQLQAEVEALKEEHARYRASAEEMWETAKRHGGRMLAEKRRADVAEAEVEALREALTVAASRMEVASMDWGIAAALNSDKLTHADDMEEWAKHARTALSARAATAREGRSDG